MLELLSQEALRPFLTSGALVLALLLLEIALVMLGLSSGSEADGPEMDAGDFGGADAGVDAADLVSDFGVDPAVAASIEAEIGGMDGGADLDAAIAPEMPSGGLLGFLGLRSLPLTVWLALFSACFSSIGLFVQVMLHGFLGFMLPSWLMVPLAIAFSLAATRVLARIIVHLIPRDETSAVSTESLGRRRGTVIVGVARRGSPAQVRITDRFGNDHYPMLEPLSDNDEIGEGAEVLVLRIPGGVLRIVPIN